MKEPLSVFVVVFTIVNIAACLWLMWWTARHRQSNSQSDSQTSASSDSHAAHVWDGDLTELNNPLPRWWLGLFILTIVFGVTYLIIYPGLGNYAGTQGWSQTGQHAAEAQAAQERLDRHLGGLNEQTIEQLAANPNAMATARNLFGLYCSTCHGSDARGAKGFPNLADDDWLGQSDPESIYQTIANGRTGVMPGWSAVLGRQGVEEVTAYVLSLSGRKVPEDFAVAGRKRFAELCVGCHGMQGEGNPLLGAPNLADNTWLYGSSLDVVRDTIANGRTNQMPAHEELLGPMKTKLLAAYVVSLSSQRQSSSGQP